MECKFENFLLDIFFYLSLRNTFLLSIKKLVLKCVIKMLSIIVELLHEELNRIEQKELLNKN